MKKTQTIVADANNDNFFQQLTVKYLPYWPLFTILLVLSLASSIMYLIYADPVYESSASILIKDERKGQEDSKMEEALNLFNTKKIVENELKILTSKEIVGNVVIHMRLYAPLFTESGWHDLYRRSAYLVSPVVLEVQDPLKLIEAKKVYYKIASDTASVEVNGKIYPLTEWISSPWGTIRFSKNPHFNPVNPTDSTEKASVPYKYYFTLTDVIKETDDIQESILATPTNKQSSVIELSIRDAVPERGEAIITNIITSYNLNEIKKKNEIASSTLHYIEERLESTKHQLDSVENSIQKYRDRTGVVDISEQSKLYIQNVSANDQQRNKMKIQMNVLDEVQNYLETRNESGSEVPSTFEITDPTLTQLLTKLNNAQSEYARLRKTTAENNPILSSIQAEIVKTKADILETINSQKANLKASQRYVDKIASRDSAMVNAIPQKEKDLVEASRQRNTTADIYAYLLQKREEIASYSVRSLAPDSYIVDKASSTPFPVSPKKSLVLILGGIVPLLLGGGLISLKSMFNNKILYRTDIESLTSFPVVGEIIQEKFENNLVTASKERSFIIEQFRSLRSSIKNLVTPPEQIKKLAITSSIQGEGKSFVAANLANSMARSGKKVVLVELDLHQPSICEMLGIARGVGITDYLLGKAQGDEILLQTSYCPELYFVSAGNLHEDASELLMNGKIEQLFKYLDTKADVIIMDMPPINPISDIYVVAPLCDYTLYIVRHGKVPKNNIKVLKENMKSHNINKVAIIFNGIKKRGIGKFSYGYGYGYGYDYKSTYDSYGKAGKKNRKAIS